MSHSESTANIDILILAEDFYPKISGGAFKDWNTAVALADAGDTVTVVTPRNKDTSKHEVVDGVEIRRPFRGVPKDNHPNSLIGQLTRVGFALLTFPYLLFLCYSEEFDVIYSTNHLMHPLGKVIRAFFSIPMITYIGYSPVLKDDTTSFNPLVLLEKMNFEFFMGDEIICQSPVIQDTVRSANNERPQLIHGTVSEHKLRSAVENTEHNWTDQSDTQLVFVGRFVNIKNPVHPISTLEEISEDYYLSMIGDGPQRPKVERARESSSVSDRIEVVGQLPHKETLKRIYQSDILLLTSDTESYPAVAFEALCLGTPVVATEVSALPTLEQENLFTGSLEEFPDLIRNMETESKHEIDEEAIRKFSIRRFTSEVRTHMLQVVTRKSQV